MTQPRGLALLIEGAADSKDHREICIGTCIVKLATGHVSVAAVGNPEGRCARTGTSPMNMLSVAWCNSM